VTQRTLSLGCARIFVHVLGTVKHSTLRENPHKTVILAVFVIESLQPDPPPGPRSNTDDVLELRLGTTEGAPDGE